MVSPKVASILLLQLVPTLGRMRVCEELAPTARALLRTHDPAFLRNYA